MTVPMTETMIEPMHPSPLEKKTNTPARYPVVADRYAGPSSSVGLDVLAEGAPPRSTHPSTWRPERLRQVSDTVRALACWRSRAPAEAAPGSPRRALASASQARCVGGRVEHGDVAVGGSLTAGCERDPPHAVTTASATNTATPITVERVISLSPSRR
jgi:2-keto-4-pentenoate hydratase